MQRIMKDKFTNLSYGGQDMSRFRSRRFAPQDDAGRLPMTSFYYK